MRPGVRSEGRPGAASPLIAHGSHERAASPVLWENFPDRGYLAT